MDNSMDIEMWDCDSVCVRVMMAAGGGRSKNVQILLVLPMERAEGGRCFSDTKTPTSAKFGDDSSLWLLPLQDLDNSALSRSVQILPNERP